MARYAMAVDTKRCVACNSCALACKVEHNLPNGVLWNRGLTDGGAHYMTPAGEYPAGLSMGFYTMSCQHCANPVCVDVCPTGATVKREDGIVTVDYETCIGCKACMTACPYQGVRTYIENPEWALDFKTGDAAVPNVKEGTVSKCTFCVERIDRGERPACIDLCFAQARYFGDLDDPESEISQVLATREYYQLEEDKGTNPNFFFLI